MIGLYAFSAIATYYVERKNIVVNMNLQKTIKKGIEQMFKKKIKEVKKELPPGPSWIPAERNKLKK